MDYDERLRSYINEYIDADDYEYVSYMIKSLNNKGVIYKKELIEYVSSMEDSIIYVGTLLIKYLEDLCFENGLFVTNDELCEI